MKYSVTFLLILFAFAACKDDEPEGCEEIVVPEPFRFTIIDEADANQLNSNVRPGNTRIYYLDGGEEITLGLDFEGTGANTYGVSLILSLRSARGGVETFLVERGDAVDTLSVQIIRQEPGNNCSEFIFNTITFNEVPAMIDTLDDVPVFVLIE